MYKWLVGIMMIGLMTAGCGQATEQTYVTEASKPVVEANNIALLCDWPERENFDAAFAASRNATLAVWTETCSCGAKRLNCQQSYTDAALGAAAVRECPLDEMVAKDNLVTEQYAVSLYCPDCGEQELSLNSKEIWMYRQQMGQPHYHTESRQQALYWCKVFVDYADQKWAYVYDWQKEEEQLVERIQLQNDAQPLETLGQKLLENSWE